MNQTLAHVQPSMSAVPVGGRKVLFSAVKNEAPFLLEWIAYHKVIGFDEIVICSNPSTDGTDEILAALALAGEIRHLQTKPEVDQSPQGEASKAFSNHIGYTEGDWYIWLDADEFLNIHVGDRTVAALVEALGTRRCMLINWRIFGTGGNRTFPGRFISAAFAKASEKGFPGNTEIKSLFRKDNVFKSFAVLGIHRPLVDPSIVTRLDLVATGAGLAPTIQHRSHRLWVKGAEHSKTHKVARGEVGWNLAQINHYIVRTEEFFALKRSRGDGWKAGAVGTLDARRSPEFFAQYDRNEQEDRSILFWEGAVTEEMGRLMAIGSVDEAVNRSQQLVNAAIASLDQPPLEDVPETKPTAPAFVLTLPDAESAFLREHYAKASTILEYGSGGSTVLATSLGKRVISVESDVDWAARLAEELLRVGYPSVLHHVDIGPTKDWGRPRDTSGTARYHRYALSVWDRPDLGEPDLVLIDGRFRAACLAAVMLRAKRPTTVLFDDYVPRRYYHAVERLARKEETIGRMARFTVTPGPIPPDMLTEVFGWFTDPR
jgi:hypothetical protein